MNDDIDIKITNPNKIVYGSIKKIDLINYYNDIFDYIYPFIKNRAISEIRCHGCFKNCFFKKHPQNSSEKLIQVSSKNELLNEVQLGTIELHPYANFVSCNLPNVMIFDLDPDEDLSIKKLREGVKLVKQLLDELNLTSFLKTSGGKGYHIIIPFKKVKSWATFENFSKNVATILESRYPQIFTTNIRKDSRNGKIFIDFLRNKKGATCVAPYSLRARDKLPISMPILWSDLNKIRPNQINIKNYKNYLTDEVWENYFKVNQKLS